MLSPNATVFQLFLIPLAALVIYYDVRYRRIPNPFVLATLISGLTLNFAIGGFSGVLSSLGGCVFAFILMFMLHVFGAMGAGDVKLFAAIGSVIGAQLVLPTFVVVVITGGLLALFQHSAIGNLQNHDASRSADLRRFVARLADAEI